MNHAQAQELLELLRSINQALERIEKLLSEEFGPAVGREDYKPPLMEASTVYPVEPQRPGERH